MQSDIRAVVDADTRLLEQALQKAVAKPYKLNFSVDQGASGALGRIRSQLGEFDKSLAASNARVMAFSLSASSMFAVTKSLKEMVRVTVEVERKMTSINSILGAGRSQFKQFGNDLFKIARDTSTSFEEVADAAEELARQGVGIEETLKRTSSAMKLAKVSGVEVKTAVDAITAALNSNNDAWLDSEKLINKLVAVDAKFAVSAGGLAEAIKRVGSVAADAGLDIDDLVAAITSAQQTTARGEAVIGNALKTIFTRAQRPKVLEDFESLGIATKDAVGNMRPLAGVLTEVAKRYDDLSSAQQQSVSELVGGVYQINILKALFRDLGKETSFFGSALKTSKNATNEADRRIAELNETLDSLFKKLTVNLTQVGSDVGSNVFGPLFKNLLKSANAGLEQVNRDINGESGQIFGKSFEAILKGVGNTLNSPILIGGFVTISRFLLQTAREGREAIKTLAGLNNSFHSLEVVSADAANWLRQNPKYLQDIVIASKSAEGATRALTAATAAYNKEVSQRAALDATVGTHASAIARAAGIVAIPGRGGTERLQPKKAAVGLIPQAQEMAGAYAGGYKPGQVKDMNVPGMGRVYYNTAEKVKWFPGMAQPAIMPPQSSRAGRNYEQNFAQTHGFNPYMAGGMIPNFAKKDIIQRIGKKEIFNRFAKHYGQGRDYEGFYNIHGEEFNRKNLTPEEAKIYANITSAISPSVPDYVAAQFAAPIFNKYLQTKSTNVDDYLDLPPTRRVSRHKNVGSLGLFGIKGTLSSSGNIRTRDDARRAGLSKALSGLDLGSDDTAKTRHYARGILQDKTAFPIDTNVIQAILGGKKPSKKEAAKLIALANEFAELNQITSGASGLQAAIFKSNSSHREKYSEQSVRSALSGIQRMSGGFVPNFTSRIVGSGKNLFVTSLYDALGGEFGGGPEYPFVKKGKGAAFLAQGKTTEMIKMIRPYIESGGDVIFGAHVGGDPIEGIKGNRFIHDKIHEELPYLKGESSGASTEALGKLFNQYKKKIDERAGGVKGRGLKTLRSIISPFIEPDILDFYQKNPEFGGSVSRLVKFGPESLAPTASEHHLYPHAIAGQALGRINPVNIEGLFARAGNLDKKQITKLFGLVRIPRIPIGIAYNQGDETHKSLGFANSGLVPNFAANPELQKAFTERFYRAKRGGRYAGGEFESEGEKFETLSSEDNYSRYAASNFPLKTYRDEFGNSIGIKRGFTGLSSLSPTPTTVSGSISAITRRAPDEITKRQLLRLAREFDYGVSSFPFKDKKYFSAFALGEKRMIRYLDEKAKSSEKYGLLDDAAKDRALIKDYQKTRKGNVRDYLKYRRQRSDLKSLPTSDYLFRGVSLDEITNLRRLGQVTSLGAANADEKLGTFITSSFGKAAGFGAATLKESGQGYVLALDKKRILSRPTAESIFGSEEKNTIKAGRIEKDDVLGVVDLKTRQLRSLEEFAAKNDEISKKQEIERLKSILSKPDSEILSARRYSMARGLVPNFANIYSRTSMGSGMASITGKTAEIMRISTEEDGRGGSGEIYSDLFKAFRSHKVKAVIGKLIPQNREPRENTDVSRVKAILPQITRARFGKKSILGVGNSEIHLGAKTFDKDLAANASLILDQLQMDAEYPFLSTYLNKGLVPNFAWSKTNEMPKEFLAKYPESKAAIHKGRMYSPEVRKMLQKLQLGGQPLDRNLLDALIERDIPIREVVPPSSIEDLPSESLIKSALDIKQAERIGKLKELSAGVPITVRQDVPSMTRKGVGVVKTEGPEGFRSYDSFVVFDNPTMRSSAQLEKASLSIGAGKDKAPLLKISGKLAEQQSLPRDLNNWTQVGFNPDRHSYYYDRKTKTPVIGGSKAVQIGNTVFVKDAEFGKREDFLYSTGLIPNFSPLSAAISRESAAVNPGLIRVGSHSALRGPGNPDGMGVYNLRDEPLGLGQGVERAKSMGLNPKTHGIPNYANGGIRQWLGRQKEAYMGNESSPDPGNKFMGAMALSMAAPAISTFGGNSAGTKMGEEAVNALSLYFTLSTFLRGPKGGKAAIGISAISGLFGILKQANNSFNTLDSEVQVLRDNIQKASGGLNKYVTTLEQLQESYLNNNVSSEKIGKLQNKLAESLSQLPAELRGQLIGAKSGGQVQEIIGRYTESQDAKLREKEFAMGLSSLLNEQSILRRGSLLGFGEAGTKTGKEKLDAIADSLLGSLSESGLKKIGGAAGLGSGGLLSVLGAAGLGGSTLTQLARVNPDELKAIQARMVGEQGSRESDVQKFKALAPQRQREIEQAQMLEKRMKGARDVIRQTFEQIGQFANMRATMMGRRGIMNAAGIGEQIQGVAGLIGETGSPTQAAMANYKAQIAANQIQAASGISNVFGGLRGGISTLFSNTDLTRMGDIPARMRAGQGSLMNILGGSSVSGIGEGAISLFKSLGKDDDVAEIKKLMADSNEKLVEIYQTLEEQNKLAEIQKNIALQRAEFERTLKVGGGLGSFMDKGVRMQQLSDIYSAKFGVNTGIFKGQGSVDLLKNFLNLGGQPGSAGFSKVLGVATEERAKDIISAQSMYNKAFQGTGLSFENLSMSQAREKASTQIAAELKTGDSAMEKQMAQLQAALANTLSSSMGGQFNNAAQVFANVLAGSSTFIELNSTINSTQEVLKTLDATLKSLQGGAGYGVRAGGNIPISAAATEKMMAKAGGYNPGYIRRAGNLIYNSAERVDYLPGVREPIISPPPGSLAGFLHRQNLNAAFGFAAGGSNYGNYTRFDPNLKYLVQPSMGDPLTLEQRTRARQAGYELLTPEDRAKMLANQKRFRGGKYNITDLTADFREGSEVGRRLPKNLISSFNISTPTDLGFGGNKFIESQKLSGFEKSIDLEEFIKRKNLVRKAFGEQLFNINKPSTYAKALEKELGSAYYLKPKDGAQGFGVLGNSGVSSSTKIKGSNYFAQRAISNMSGGEFRVTTVGGKYGASVADIGYKRTAKGIIGDAFYELAGDPTKGKTVGQRFDQFLSKVIAKSQAKRALASLPPEMRAGVVAGFDVAETGTKGIKKALQAVSEVTDIGREMFKGAGGVIEANLSDPTGYSGSLAKPSTNLKTAKLYSKAVNKNALDKIIQSKAFQKTASVGKGLVKGLVNPAQIIADTSVELGSRYAGAFAGRQKGVGAHKFGALSDVVGQTYLEERMDQLDEPGSDSFFGLAPGSWLRYGLTNESLGLMESYGDVAAAQKRYNLSRDRKMRRMPPSQPSQSFTPGVRYGNYNERNRFLSSTYGEIGAATKYNNPLENIGSLRSNLAVLGQNDQRRGIYEKEIRDRSVQYNADIIAKMFGINDPKQLQRLQVGVRGAMESGNLQGYVKSLGKPVAQPAAAQTQPDGQKTPVAAQSKLDINLNLGGNVKTEGSQAEKDAVQAAINTIREQLTKEITAIADSLGASARVALANARNPNTASQYE